MEEEMVFVSTRYSLFCIDFRLQHADIGKIAVEVIVVQTIADHELVGNLKAGPVGRDIGQPALRLVEQRADLERGGLTELKHLYHRMQGAAGVQNILQNHHMAAADIVAGVQLHFHPPGGLAALIGRDRHEVKITGDGNAANHVGVKHDYTTKDTQKNRAFIRIFLGQDPAKFFLAVNEISKDKIFKSIDKIKGMKTLIKESYVSLKNRLGRVPLLYDFYENQEIDPLVIIKEYKTYYAFMQAMEKDKYKNSLNEQEKLTLEYLSKTILSGVRPDELAILSQLLYRDHIGVADFIKEYQKTYGIKISASQVNEAIQVLQGHFVSKEAEYQKFRQIDILENDQSGMIRRLKSYTERLAHIQFYTQVEDIIKVGIARYKDKYFPGRIVDSPFVLYEKYSRRDVSLLMNCGKDLSSIMYGMKRIEDDVFIFITYHKEESQDEKNYVDGKPDYADTFEDDLIFKWDSQIGKGLDSSYMKDVLEAERKHLLVKKSDAETSFYYMGQFTVVEARNARKEDNRGRMQPITKVTMKMQHPVREDLLRYLQSNITA